MSRSEVIGSMEDDVMEQEHCTDSEDEDALLEPRFNYESVAGPDAVQMLNQHILTSIAVHDKLIAVGTQSGYVWIMDHSGYTDHKSIPTVRPHRTAVTRLGMDLAGNYVISCANDGRVAITGLGTSTLNRVLNLTIMPRSLALSPDFSRINATPQYVVGERNLIIYERRSIIKDKETTIFRGGEKDGFISRISWLNNYIAFTNDGGTRIYDRSSEKMVTLLNPSHDVDRVRTSRFPPSHCWLSDSSLAVGWADTVTILVITDDPDTGSKRAEIHFSWNLEELYCSGISCVLNTKGVWKEIVVFGLRPETEDEDSRDFCDGASMVSVESALLGPPPKVQMCVFQPEDFKSYELVAEDTLDMNARPGAQPCQFYMAGLPSCDSYFLLGPTQLVTATPYSAFDTVTWRIANGKYEDAWELARERATELEGTEADQHTVGRQMIEHLLQQQKARMAVSKLKEVCGDLREEWEWAVGLFEKNALSTLLSEVLPTSNPQLEPECYEAVLQAALYNDVKLFKRLVQLWSGDLYRVGSLTSMTIRRINDSTEAAKGGIENYPFPLLTREDESCLYIALAKLYVYERKFEMAIKLYLVQRDMQLFNVIDKFQLFEMVKERISELMHINPDRAVRLLLENEESVEPRTVLAQLHSQPKLQLTYLNRLSNRADKSLWTTEFADRTVRLLADHEPKKLHKFLETDEFYHIIRALDICRAKGFVEEMILLNGKSGNHLEALDLILKKQKRLDKAIEYCKEHDDPDLWSGLMNEVLKNPEQIAQLLSQAGSSVDPLTVIQRIPISIDIPGLRNALAKVLRDCDARIKMLGGCDEATKADSRVLLSNWLNANQRTFSVGTRMGCIVCEGSFSGSQDLIMFGCGHSAHVICSIEYERRNLLESGLCLICNEHTKDDAAA